MIDSDKRDSRTRGEIEWDFVILCGKRSFSVINKVEEIRISCECVGGLILEAIPNTCVLYSRNSHYMQAHNFL